MLEVGDDEPPLSSLWSPENSPPRRRKVKRSNAGSPPHPLLQVLLLLFFLETLVLRLLFIPNSGFAPASALMWPRPPLMSQPPAGRHFPLELLFNYEDS